MKSWILVFLAACTTAEAQAPEPAAVAALFVSVNPEPTPEVATEVEPEVVEPPASEPEVDPYEGAENWCHEISDLPPCRREDDTSANEELPTKCSPDPRTGRVRICVDPWWVEGHERVCVPRPLGKEGRAQGRAELVAFIYRRVNGQHRGVCRPQSWWRWGQGHEVDEGKCNPKALSSYMTLVSWRETKHDDEKTHLDNRDKKAAAGSWERRREVFNGKNPHYWQGYRWKSRGRYGQNPALHIDNWDVAAPPEALCNFVISTETYLTTMRECHSKLLYLRGGDPDWWDLHHCASGGKFNRPEVIPTEPGTFYARAHSKRIKLNPFQKVPVEWLGQPIDHDMDTVREIETQILSHLTE